MRTLIALLSVVAGLPALLPACGAEGGFEGITLTLTFSPADLPADTAYIRVYVLPTILPDNTSISCENFVGPTADKKIYDYTDRVLASPQVPINEVTGGAVTLEKLPEGLLMFYIEAVDDKMNILAYGCGKGQIDRGNKTYIPIRLVAY